MSTSASLTLPSSLTRPLTRSSRIGIPLGETSLFHAPTNVPKEALILMADIFPT